jgi:hypothetical protein
VKVENIFQNRTVRKNVSCKLFKRSAERCFMKQRNKKDIGSKKGEIPYRKGIGKPSTFNI